MKWFLSTIIDLKLKIRVSTVPLLNPDKHLFILFGAKDRIKIKPYFYLDHIVQ
jgi:hypothetical protein